MNNSVPRIPDTSNQQEDNNSLIEYIQSLEPSTIARLSQISPAVANIMEQNLRDYLGVLPTTLFEVIVTTERESLAQLLASAMQTGYFLRQAEERMDMEQYYSLFNQEGENERD